MDDRALRGGRDGEVAHGWARGVGQHLRGAAAPSRPADLDRDPDERLLAALAAALEALLVAAEPELVDLDLSPERARARERPSPGAASGGSARRSHSARARAGAAAAWRRSRDGGWRPGRQPRTRSATACGFRASPSPPSPRSAARTPCTATAAAADASRPLRRPAEPGRGSLPASARRAGTRGTPPRREALLELQDAQRVCGPRHPAKLQIRPRRNQPDTHQPASTRPSSSFSQISLRVG